jgi:hypothetical protein
VAAECEFVLPNGKVCAIDAEGRCDECGDAFCRSHGSTRVRHLRTALLVSECRRCLSKPFWGERFPATHRDPAGTAAELRAVNLLVTLERRFSPSRLPSINGARNLLDLGLRKVQVGYSMRDDGSPEEEAKSMLAWLLMAELVRFGALTTKNDDSDRELWEGRLQAPVRARYEDRGIVMTGTPLSIHDPMPAVKQETHERMRAALAGYRPSAELVDAVTALDDLSQQADQALHELPPAQRSDVVDYVRSGAGLDPDEWSRSSGVLLRQIAWSELAGIFSAAGFAPNSSVQRRVRGFLGRERTEIVQGWVISGAAAGSHYHVSRLLTTQGEVVNGDGAVQNSAGAEPSQIHAMVRRPR